MDQGIISKDFYVNDSNNQNSSFTLDKYKVNDPQVSLSQRKKIGAKTGIKSKNARIIAANRNSTSGVVTKFRLPTEVEWEYATLGSS